MIMDLVPANTQGKATDLGFSVTLLSAEAAGDCFRRAAKRLFNPPLWHELAGWASAHFMLTGSSGEEIYRLAAEGDYLRIDVPGPGPSAGDGYDWVRLERLEDHSNPHGEQEWVGMKLRPSGEPGKMAADTAHFFRGEATSSFIIQRTGETVTVYYYGRNEVPNTATEKLADNIRNAVISAGALFSLSEAQWSALCKGFLTEEIGG